MIFWVHESSGPHIHSMLNLFSLITVFTPETRTTQLNTKSPGNYKEPHHFSVCCVLSEDCWVSLDYDFGSSLQKTPPVKCFIQVSKGNKNKNSTTDQNRKCIFLTDRRPHMSSIVVRCTRHHFAMMGYLCCPEFYRSTNDSFMEKQHNLGCHWWIFIYSCWCFSKATCCCSGRLGLTHVTRPRLKAEHHVHCDIQLPLNVTPTPLSSRVTAGFLW